MLKEPSSPTNGAFIVDEIQARSPVQPLNRRLGVANGSHGRQNLARWTLLPTLGNRGSAQANFPDDGWTCVIDVLVEEQKGMVFGPVGFCVLTVGGSGEALYLSPGFLHFKQAPGCLPLSFEDLHTIE